MAKSLGTQFTKDGKTRTAHTPADAVKFKFDGWTEVKPESKKASSGSSSSTN